MVTLSNYEYIYENWTTLILSGIHNYLLMQNEITMQLQNVSEDIQNHDQMKTDSST